MGRPSLSGTVGCRGPVTIIIFLVAAAVLTCNGSELDDSDRDSSSTEMEESRQALAKITFDLDEPNERGLIGPPDGLRALNYEFCIPGDPEHTAEVRSIDPTIQLFRGGRGRVGCGADQILCIGSTHQPGFRGVLLKLAALPYIERIDQTFYE